MSQVVLEAARPNRPKVPRSAFFPVAIAVPILAFAIIATGDYRALVIVGAPAGFIIAVCALLYTSHHTEWLIFVIGLLYLAISTSLLSEDERAFLHYGVLLAFCLPIIARLFKSGLLLEGNFKIYCAYFAWELATTSSRISWAEPTLLPNKLSELPVAGLWPA
jgi:hypothetical protein